MNYKIDYLDCKNNFQKATKKFKDYDVAKQWLFDNFEKFDIDWIQHIN